MHVVTESTFVCFSSFGLVCLDEACMKNMCYKMQLSIGNTVVLGPEKNACFNLRHDWFELYSSGKSLMYEIIREHCLIK